jgi:hypothetical protein
MEEQGNENSPRRRRRGRYPKEFRRDAAALVIDQRRTIADVAGSSRPIRCRSHGSREPARSRPTWRRSGPSTRSSSRLRWPPLCMLSVRGASGLHGVDVVKVAHRSDSFTPSSGALLPVSPMSPG